MNTDDCLHGFIKNGYCMDCGECTTDSSKAALDLSVSKFLPKNWESLIPATCENEDCDGETCQECCPHGDLDHGICLDCQLDLNDEICNRAHEMSEGER